MGFQIRAAIARKQPLPDWVNDEPPVGEFDRFFLTAFELLDTCRTSGFGDGPIPWTAVREFCKSRELDRMMTNTVEAVILRLDKAVMAWRAKNRPKGGTSFRENRDG